MALVSVEEAQQRLLNLATPMPIEQVPLVAAAGRWIAGPVHALRTQPSADLSMMDGYALRFADLGATLAVVGESAAGRPYAKPVGAGEAVRIFTGAAMPMGTDTVLVQEEALREGDRVRLAGEGPIHAGANVRPAGMDFFAGASILAAGERVTPARIALAAMAGHATLPVRRRPRIAVATTGDELIAVGAPLNPDKLPDSNAPMLAAMLATLPVELIQLGILPDRIDVLVDRLGAVEADILMTVGGASVGDHDLVRPALEQIGVAIDFWRIAMRPGKPLMAGTRGGMVALGLPGNPVSAFVTATLFLLPLIRAQLGAPDPLPATSQAPLGIALPANGPRQDYRRARLVEGRLIEPQVQDSALLQALAGADCLIVRPPHAPQAAAGDVVPILQLA